MPTTSNSCALNVFYYLDFLCSVQIYSDDLLGRFLVLKLWTEIESSVDTYDIRVRKSYVHGTRRDDFYRKWRSSFFGEGASMENYDFSPSELIRFATLSLRPKVCR